MVPQRSTRGCAGPVAAKIAEGKMAMTSARAKNSAPKPTTRDLGTSTMTRVATINRLVEAAMANLMVVHRFMAGGTLGAVVQRIATHPADRSHGTTRGIPFPT